MGNKTFGLARLEILMKEYINTLDNKREEESFLTNQGYAEVELEKFFEWLKTRELYI